MHYEKYTIENISTKISSGATPSRKNPEYWKDGTIFWLKSDQVGNYEIHETNEMISRQALQETSVKLVEKNTITLAMYGEGVTRGKVSIIKVPMTTNQACCNINVNEDIANYKYVYYYLKKSYEQLRNLSSGVRRNLNSETIKQFPIYLPGLPIQNKIVDEISPFDDKIKINKKSISLLEEYVQLLFYKWFLEFNFPNGSEKPYKDSGGEMEDVNGKLIPKGWEIKNINGLASIKTDSIDPSKHPKEYFSYYDIPTFDETRLFSKVQGKDIGSNKYTVTQKNILVSKLNPWFKRVVYPFQLVKGICSTEFVVWEPVDDNIQSFLYVIASSDRFTKYLTNAASGTSNSHKRVQPQNMMKYEIPFNEEIVNEFSRIIKPLIDKVHALIAENEILKESRNLLIRKLIK